MHWPNNGSRVVDGLLRTSGPADHLGILIMIIVSTAHLFEARIYGRVTQAGRAGAAQIVREGGTA
jgi:hypothetical protein